MRKEKKRRGEERKIRIDEENSEHKNKKEKGSRSISYCAIEIRTVYFSNSSSVPFQFKTTSHTNTSNINIEPNHYFI